MMTWMELFFLTVLLLTVFFTAPVLDYALSQLSKQMLFL